MIKAVIVDDDPVAIELLINLLQDVSTDIVVTSKFTDPRFFLKSRGQLNYDVLFLDIEMPAINGISLQGNESKPVVFVSGEVQSHLDDISNAVNRKKVTFLTKPLDHSKVLNAVNKIRDWVADSSRIRFSTSEGIAMIPVSEIQLICSPKLRIGEGYGSVDSRDKIVFCTDSKPLLLRGQNFDVLLKELPHSLFCQISSQVIISKNHLKTYRAKDLDMMVYDGKKTEVKTFAIGKEFNGEFKLFAAS